MNVTASLLMGIYITFDLLVSEFVNLIFIRNKLNVTLVDSHGKQIYKLNLAGSQGYRGN